MRPILKLTIFCLAIILIAAGFSKKPPAPVEVVTPAPSPVTSPTPVIVDATKGRKLLTDIATTGHCAKELYGDPSKKNPAVKKNQGKAKPGYLKGLVLTYVKLICEKDQDPILKQVYNVATAPLGDASKDALAHYGLKPASPTDRLNTVAAMMIGSNARESSWRPCVGRDVAAKASDVKGCLYDGVKYFGGGETCEAGLPQTSFNSIKGGVLKELYDAYLEYPRGCFEREFYEGISCDAANWKNHGKNPAAVAYQGLAKSCPAFSIESGFVMFRTNRAHYGPLNRKTAEVYPSCVSMFEKVRVEIEKDPTLCHVL
ncbi:putative peptidoglycan binding protein [Bdellovibrio phage MAC3UK]|nr:putative peptidoglycan binding protein [Bdellovibrio phage MAC3UK]